MIDIKRTPGMTDAEYIELLEATLRAAFHIGGEVQAEANKLRQDLGAQAAMLRAIIWLQPNHEVQITLESLHGSMNCQDIQTWRDDNTQNLHIKVGGQRETH